jgi:SAM-dependent methyltransferase
LTCPCCGGRRVDVFYEVEKVPVNSVLQLPSREEALNFPTGDIALGFCSDCGFVYNAAFRAELLEYSDRYDPTQAFSPTFNQWHQDLARRLIERYGLRHKTIIEIGCGKGEFLNMLCELGDNSGLGFDPAYVPKRDVQRGKTRAKFISGFYDERYAGERGDFVCCKMTLEHIQPAADFMGTVRRAVGDDPRTVVFFQVPDVERILEELAFWDVYYEHCSYYSMGSLGRLFRRTGFEVIDLAREYDNQYLMVEARPATGTHRTPLPQENDLKRLRCLARDFATRLSEQKARWQGILREYKQRGRKVVIWGSGSKGVAFLTTLGMGEGADQGGIEYVVDINPHRQGFYMAKTGQRIVGPDFLRDYRPDAVIVMNPVYEKEIRQDLAARGLEPEVLTT